MTRITDALRKIHSSEPWRQIAPAAASEADVEDIMAALPSGTAGGTVDAAASKSSPVQRMQNRKLASDPRTWAPPEDPLSARLVVRPSADPVAVEQYRQLGSLLHRAQVERGLKVVMVTSAMPAEGKTLTATNLAMTLSETFNRNVLLIDADLRRSTIARLFGASHLSGVSEALRAEQESRLTTLSPASRLSVLLGGKPDPNPIADVSSERMRDLLADAAVHFDWVIVDTPPAAVFPDVGLLSQFVDGTLLVIRPGISPVSAIQRAVEAVTRERIIGVVLNGAPVTDVHSYDYDPMPTEAEPAQADVVSAGRA